MWVFPQRQTDLQMSGQGGAVCVLCWSGERCRCRLVLAELMSCSPGPMNMKLGWPVIRFSLFFVGRRLLIAATMSDRNNWREEGCIWAHGLRGCSLLWQKGHGNGKKLPACISMDRKQLRWKRSQPMNIKAHPHCWGIVGVASQVYLRDEIWQQIFCSSGS